MIFFTRAICSFPKNYAIRSGCLILRVSYYTKSVCHKSRNVESNLINNKQVFFHKNNPTLLNFLTRSCSSNVTKKEENIPWSNGICDKLVKSSGPLQPYLRIIRLDKPTGKLSFTTDDRFSK